MTWYFICQNNIQQQHPENQTLKRKTIGDKKVKLQFCINDIVGIGVVKKRGCGQIGLKREGSWRIKGGAQLLT